ncbi:apolipoprotein N-acyltransferase [Candidatus Coxiella mudrowiae]|uniref:Apolipoprotein N-acyltransferase n=1 Tax=Candidatus Coxiella mudrowiae TaxID=2054173 RepID=A0ABM5UUD0_9COXI|nr:apolipoprotein N-acyltransferase [Candidatus Coxiella mudrowiae]AKQ33589.1 Apolipoprotein N-acyltransferase [Candidatus Coxiella mudrowiae]
MNKIFFNLFAILAGALLALAFAPANWFPIAFISPAILLSIWERYTPLQSLWRGWLFGLGFFGIGTSWIYVSIHKFGNANVPLAVLITILFIFILSVFIAIQGFSFSLLFRRKSMVTTSLFAFPAWWVIWEWLRSELFTGFPWLFLGYSQIHFPLKGFAPLIGVYGVSLIVALISGCLYLLFFYKEIKIKILSVLVIVILLLMGGSLTTRQWTHPQKKILQVSIVQGNIYQTIKWDINCLFSILHTYYAETSKHWQSDIIVWPEAGIPIYSQQIPSFMDSLNKKAKENQTALIAGIPIYHEKTQQVFNGLTVLGEGHGLYLKRHLVPFGEYLPLTRLFSSVIKYFNIPMSDLSSGPWNQPAIYAKNISFAPFICYEIAYPFEVLNSMEGKAFIVVVSDDSWFNDTIASAQQLQITQMRALETGRYLIYSTNTGITAIIDPSGKIHQSVPQNKLIVLTGQITPMSGKTPLMKWNYYPILGIVIIFLLLELI